MATPLTTDAALLICGPASVALVSACTLFRFAEHRSNCVSFFSAVLGVTISFSIVAVVPFDVWHALTTAAVAEADEPARQDGEAQAAYLLRKSWSAIYWTTAVLCYVLLPLLMEFEASGDFCIKARMATAVRRNIVFYAVYIVVGALVLVWLIVNGEIEGDLESYCIAASNAWGLLVLTVLMGFGLVGVPRHIWRLACPKEQLQRLYISAVTRDELRLSRVFDLQDSMDKVRAELARCGAPGDPETAQAYAYLSSTLEKCEALHAELSSGGRRDLACDLTSRSLELRPTGACAGSASESAPLEVSASGPDAGAGRCEADVEPGPSRGLVNGIDALPGTRASASGAPRLAKWAKLHGELKVAALEARRAASRWDDHVRRCMFLEDLDGMHYKAAAELLCGRPHIGFPRGVVGHARTFFWACWNKLLVFWLRNLRSRALRFLSYFCGTMSAVIVLGQMTMFDEGRGWRLSALAYVFSEDRGPWVTQGLCVIPLGYMTYTAYFSIFRLRVPGWYGLYANHNTDMGSLLWCASILARLAAPMCYHFLLLIRVRGTTFQNFMGKMNVVPVLGESFNDIFPRIIAVLCLFNLLNIYSRIVRFLSLGTVDFELAAGVGGEDPLAEGRLLMERERRRHTEERATELPARERLAVPFAQGSSIAPGEA